MNNFIEKAKAKHGDKYDYSSVEYIDNKTKVKIICPEHGVFEQTPANHLKSDLPCPICRKNTQKITTSDYVTRASEIHNNKYDYSLVDYKSMHEKVKIICPDHGVFEQKACNHVGKNESGCPLCREQRISETKIKNKAVDIIERFKVVHGKTYDYTKVEYTHSKDNVEIICKEHGSFFQSPNHHLKGQGCPTCGKKYKWVGKDRKLTEDEFIKRSTIVHNNIYDYSKIDFVDMKTKVEIICLKHGSFIQMPHNHMYLSSKCPKCANTFSQHEEYIETYLKDNSINYTSKDKSIIPPFELDFYLPDHDLAIEVNGVYWHSELNGKNRSYHLNKTKLCEENGIRLLHINDNEIINSREIIISKLNSIFNKRKRKIFARKCEIREIDNALKTKFLTKYHLQGNDNSSVKLGLFYHNKLVSVMTFSKYRLGVGDGKQRVGEYELVRFANNRHFYVIGGASKLLKYFERNYNPVKIKTFADKRWSVGDLYFKLGFEHTHDSPPSYWYFNTSVNSYKLYHRFNFRKNVLPKKLDKFDPKKTEWQNMQDNGWNRIWDCGTMVFEKTY